MRKEIDVCDTCETKVGRGKCIMCGNDLCKDCIRYIALSGLGIVVGNRYDITHNDNNLGRNMFREYRYVLEKQIITGKATVTDSYTFENLPKFSVCQNCIEKIKKFGEINTKELLEEFYQLIVKNLVAEEL